MRTELLDTLAATLWSNPDCARLYRAALREHGLTEPEMTALDKAIMARTLAHNDAQPVTDAPTADTVAFDAALREAAHRAFGKYPAEHGRIERGLDLARAGHVTLGADTHVAQVRSHDGTRTYAVDSQCECYDYAKAPEGRCKHRYAATLVRKARKLLPSLYWASYTDCLGTVSQGIAVRYPDESLVFYYNGCESLVGFSAPSPRLVLGGCCGIAGQDARPVWQAVADAASYEGTWKGGR